MTTVATIAFGADQRRAGSVGAVPWPADRTAGGTVVGCRHCLVSACLQASDGREFSHGTPARQAGLRQPAVAYDGSEHC